MAAGVVDTGNLTQQQLSAMSVVSETSSGSDVLDSAVLPGVCLNAYRCGSESPVIPLQQFGHHPYQCSQPMESENNDKEKEDDDSTVMDTSSQNDDDDRASAEQAFRTSVAALCDSLLTNGSVHGEHTKTVASQEKKGAPTERQAAAVCGGDDVSEGSSRATQDLQATLRHISTAACQPLTHESELLVLKSMRHDVYESVSFSMLLWKQKASVLQTVEKAIKRLNASQREERAGLAARIQGGKMTSREKVHVKQRLQSLVQRGASLQQLFATHLDLKRGIEGKHTVQQTALLAAKNDDSHARPRDNATVVSKAHEAPAYSQATEQSTLQFGGSSNSRTALQTFESSPAFWNVTERRNVSRGEEVSDAQSVPHLTTGLETPALTSDFSLNSQTIPKPGPVLDNVESGQPSTPNCDPRQKLSTHFALNNPRGVSEPTCSHFKSDSAVAPEMNIDISQELSDKQLDRYRENEDADDTLKPETQESQQTVVVPESICDEDGAIAGQEIPAERPVCASVAESSSTLANNTQDTHVSPQSRHRVPVNRDGDRDNGNVDDHTTDNGNTPTSPQSSVMSESILHIHAGHVHRKGPRGEHRRGVGQGHLGENIGRIRPDELYQRAEDMEQSCCDSAPDGRGTIINIHHESGSKKQSTEKCAGSGLFMDDPNHHRKRHMTLYANVNDYEGSVGKCRKMDSTYYSRKAEETDSCLITNEDSDPTVDPDDFSVVEFTPSQASNGNRNKYDLHAFDINENGSNQGKKHSPNEDEEFNSECTMKKRNDLSEKRSAAQTPMSDDRSVSFDKTSFSGVKSPCVLMTVDRKRKCSSGGTEVTEALHTPAAKQRQSSYSKRGASNPVSAAGTNHRQEISQPVVGLQNQTWSSLQKNDDGTRASETQHAPVCVNTSERSNRSAKKSGSKSTKIKFLVPRKVTFDTRVNLIETLQSQGNRLDSEQNRQTPSVTAKIHPSQISEPRQKKETRSVIVQTALPRPSGSNQKTQAHTVVVQTAPSQACSQSLVPPGPAPRNQKTQAHSVVMQTAVCQQQGQTCSRSLVPPGPAPRPHSCRSSTTTSMTDVFPVSSQEVLRKLAQKGLEKRAATPVSNGFKWAPPSMDDNTQHFFDDDGGDDDDGGGAGGEETCDAEGERWENGNVSTEVVGVTSDFIDATSDKPSMGSVPTNDCTPRGHKKKKGLKQSQSMPVTTDAKKSLQAGPEKIVPVSCGPSRPKPPTLRDLLACGAVKAGRHNLSLSWGGQEKRASVLCDGRVEDGAGLTFSTPLAWFRAVSGVQHSKRSHAYHKILYNGCSLADISDVASRPREPLNTEVNGRTALHLPPSSVGGRRALASDRNALAPSARQTQRTSSVRQLPEQTTSSLSLLNRSPSETHYMLPRQSKPKRPLQDPQQTGSSSCAAPSSNSAVSTSACVAPSPPRAVSSLSRADRVTLSSSCAVPPTRCLSAARLVESVRRLRLIEDGEVALHTAHNDLDAFWEADFAAISMTPAFWATVDDWD